MTTTINPFISDADQPLYQRSASEVRARFARKHRNGLGDFADGLPAFEARIRAVLRDRDADATQIGIVLDFLQLADEALSQMEG